VCILDKLHHDVDNMTAVPIVFAVTDDVVHDCDFILPFEMVEKLKTETNGISTMSSTVVTRSQTKTQSASHDELHSDAISDSVPVVRLIVDESTPNVDTNQDNTPENVDYPFINFTNESDHNTLMDEQKADTTLDPLWRIASQNKGHMFVENGILYHREEVGGHEVKQLCVPHGRRLQVMRLAHDTVVSGHLGNQKTSERI